MNLKQNQICSDILFVYLHLWQIVCRFVTMDNARGGQAAIENLDGFLIKGKNLSVKVKLSKEEMLRKKVQRQVSLTIIIVRLLPGQVIPVAEKLELLLLPC